MTYYVSSGTLNPTHSLTLSTVGFERNRMSTVEVACNNDSGSYTVFNFGASGKLYVTPVSDY